VTTPPGGLPLGREYGEPGSEHRRRAGRALRKQVPRSGHGSWSPAPGRPGPLDLLEEDNRPRLPDLVRVRYGAVRAYRERMAEAEPEALPFHDFRPKIAGGRP
jgi:hypothetical protein